MSYATEDRAREEQVRRLGTDEVPLGGQHRDDVYPVDIRPKKAKIRNREEERLRLKMLAYEQASD